MTTNSKTQIRRRRRRMSIDLVLGLLDRITDRDRAILHLVWEHRVLTTDQLADIFFPSISKARQRLAELNKTQALIRFRPPAPRGTRPNHWALGPAGAHIIAAHRGVEVKDLRYRLDKTMTFLLSQHLNHQVGVNGFFARLHAYAHHHDDGTAVAEWWHEHRCARLWGDHARPDAFGRWRRPAQGGPPAELDFFLEHDTGSEPLSRLTGKLVGYTELAEQSGITTPVLFWLPNPTREANLRRLLSTPQIPVATAVQTPASAPEGPATAVWLPAGVTGPRRPLIDLTNAWDAPDHPSGETT